MDLDFFDCFAGEVGEPDASGRTMSSSLTDMKRPFGEMTKLVVSWLVGIVSKCSPVDENTSTLLGPVAHKFPFLSTAIPFTVPCKPGKRNGRADANSLQSVTTPSS